jgi:hypothetical protein
LGERGKDTANKSNDKSRNRTNFTPYNGERVHTLRQ